jgi:hypothetical protein
MEEREKGGKCIYIREKETRGGKEGREDQYAEWEREREREDEADSILPSLLTEPRKQCR